MRHSPLQRRTPLRTKTTLVGSSPLARSSRLTRQAMARKRPQRSPEEVHARRVVAQRSAGRCEVCGRVPATNWHHRRNASQGGAWCPSNGLHVCGSGTTGCHGLITVNPAIARERGWSVSAHADPAGTPVWLAGHGWAYLDARGGVTPTNRSAA